MTIPEAIEVLRNFKLDMSQPDAFRMVRAIGMAEEALKKQLTLNEILEEIEEEQRSYEADHAWNYARGLEYTANIIRKHMNDGWIPVKERLPEEKLNKVSYLVTVNFGFGADVRILIFTDGHWWCGPKILDKYVIAWRPFPEPYQKGREDA